MRTRNKKHENFRFAPGFRQIAAVVLTSAFLFAAVSAQTSVFTYQGKLNEGGAAANGQYDMQFKLFDAASAGEQVGATLLITNVQATAGIFTASLDFGAAAFSGADRFLEIAVSPAGQNNFTTLAPRQKLTSAPYSIKAANASLSDVSANSLQLGGIAANQFVQTTDARLSDARTPLPGSNDYLQNTTVLQSGVNFNIGGSGTANVFNAATQFNLGGNRILTGSTNNLFAGIGAGASNVNGNSNAFFGAAAGNKNLNGASNAFFGTSAGGENTSGNLNTFVGPGAGFKNTTGSSNVFIGAVAGNSDLTTQVSNSVAIGANAVVSQSNTIVLGRAVQKTVMRGRLVAGGGDGFDGLLFGSGYLETFAASSQMQGIYTPNIVIANALNNPISSFPICFANQSLFGVAGGIILTRCASSFSSVKEKSDVRPFAGGLDIVKRLQPVVFKPKERGGEAIGLNVEDVLEVEPSLVSRDYKGEVEKVNESSLSVLFINAFKEQQKQIETLEGKIRTQDERIKEQQRQIEALIKAVCAANPQAKVCTEEK